MVILYCYLLFYSISNILLLLLISYWSQKNEWKNDLLNLTIIYIVAKLVYISPLYNYELNRQSHLFVCIWLLRSFNSTWLHTNLLLLIVFKVISVNNTNMQWINTYTVQTYKNQIFLIKHVFTTQSKVHEFEPKCRTQLMTKKKIVDKIFRWR